MGWLKSLSSWSLTSKQKSDPCCSDCVDCSKGCDDNDAKTCIQAEGREIKVSPGGPLTSKTAALCCMCAQSFCDSHCSLFPLSEDSTILPQAVAPYVCSHCWPEMERISNSESARRKLLRCRKAEVRRRAALKSGLPAEKDAHKICSLCESQSKTHCDACGLATCLEHTGPCFLSKFPRFHRVCSDCRPQLNAAATAQLALRCLYASIYRSGVSGNNGIFSKVPSPVLEMAEECAKCRLTFTKLPGTRRHHCRACGLSICGTCLCGSIACKTTMQCPHRIVLPWHHSQNSVRVCTDCLGACNMRIAAQETLAAIYSKAQEIAGHFVRATTFTNDSSSLALYMQTYTDTAANRAERVGKLVVQGAKQATPFLAWPIAIGIHTVDLAWNFGPYALAGLAFRNEVVESLQEIQKLSVDIRSIPPKELIKGMYYLSAYTRGELRNDPFSAKTEAQRLGQALPAGLLSVLLEFAALALRCPYEEDPFEAQRFAHQQGWRLVTHRLAISSKNRPAWCLLARTDSKVAVLSIRGTDPIKSRGGDIFTDCQRGESQATHVNGSGLAHCGMIAAAHELLKELRPALCHLADAGFQIVCTGHSMGGAVAALIVNLLRDGAEDKRIPRGTELVYGVGYGVPAIVGLSFSEALAPAFVSVVNSMDLVPRLGQAALKRLSKDIRRSSHKCELDWSEDCREAIDRLNRFWEPRLRDGAPPLAPPLNHASLHPAAEVDSDDGSNSDCSDSLGDEDQQADAADTSDQQEEEFFIPGRVVWIYRVEAHLEAAVVPSTFAFLRRIIVDERMIEDHRGISYQKALLSVQAYQALDANANVVKWQRFADAGDQCPCCGSDFAWSATARSAGHRFRAMTNCRSCGLVVCRSCAETRRALPDQGIMEPARVCDRCNWRGPCSETSASPAETLSGALSQLGAEHVIH